MPRAAKLDQEREAQDEAWTAWQQALRHLRAIKPGKAGRQDALTAFRHRRLEFERARARLSHARMIVRLEGQIPGLLAGVPAMYEYHDIKVRSGKRGTKDVYYGGLDHPDGLGHGHLRVSRTGVIIFNRLPWAIRHASVDQ